MKWVGQIAIAAMLTLVYCLTLASFHPWDITLGVTLSLFLLAAFGRFLQSTALKQGQSPLAPRLLGFIPFVLAVVWEIVRGTAQMAPYSLGFRPLLHPGIVEAPIGERTEKGVAVSGMALALAPGSVLVEVDNERGVMLIHSIDASDPEMIRRDLQRFYDRYQKRVFP